MKFIPFFLLLCIFSSSHAQNCENVVALSKTVSSTVSDKSDFEQKAANFCSDYSKKQAGSSATNIGASYGAISGSFGQSNASMDEIASKVCSSSNSTAASSDAYKNYIETISPNAYAAYQQCINLTGSEVRFDVDVGAVLPSEFSITIGYNAPGTGDGNAKFSYSASAGINCSWGGATASTKTLADKEATLFKCTRADQTKPGYVKVARINGNKGALTIPWIAYSTEGVPVTTLANMQNSINILKVQSTSATAAIAGIVSSAVVDVYQCPVGKTPGWNPGGGAWGSYGCQGQLSASPSCGNTEYPQNETRPCPKVGKMRLF